MPQEEGRAPPAGPTPAAEPPPPSDLESADLEVLELVAGGHTTETIGRQLGLSERTVRRRLRAVADRLGVATTIEAVVLAVRRGAI